jgi:hypothetical protein
MECDLPVSDISESGSFCCFCCCTVVTSLAIAANFMTPLFSSNPVSNGLTLTTIAYAHWMISRVIRFGVRIVTYHLPITFKSVLEELCQFALTEWNDTRPLYDDEKGEYI